MLEWFVSTYVLVQELRWGMSALAIASFLIERADSASLK
jgi:hypothetical protein